MAVLACLASLPVSAHALLKKGVTAGRLHRQPCPGGGGVGLLRRGRARGSAPWSVTNAAGTRVDHNDLHGAGAHHLAVGVGPLPPGAYTVEWHAVSVDTHRTEGRFGFTVGP